MILYIPTQHIYLTINRFMILYIPTQHIYLTLNRFIILFMPTQHIYLTLNRFIILYIPTQHIYPDHKQIYDSLYSFSTYLPWPKTGSWFFIFLLNIFTLTINRFMILYIPTQHIYPDSKQIHYSLYSYSTYLPWP